jgi:2-dehydro-3-deoxyphosphogluconate aldolase/(4S)-4-hydroxy-2-oxoglutarate aldolase
MTSATEQQLRALGVVPVVQITHAADAGKLGRALIAGRLPVAEITFRTPAAADAIRIIHDECPDLAVGAGTVLTTEAVDIAQKAGASFVVSPGFNPAVVERCLELGLPIVPGVNAPTQVELGLSFGLTLLKFFPAVPSGGIPMLKALLGPYREVSFMPTGGITADTASQWLELPNVAAVGGTWIAPPNDITAGAFEAITARAAQARALTTSATTTPSQS